MRISNPIYGIDPAQPQIAKLIPLVNLMQGIDIHMGDEIGDKALPPVPCYKRRKQRIVMGHLEVQRGGKEPDVANEEAGCASPEPAWFAFAVGIVVVADAVGPELVAEDPFGKGLDEQFGAEFEEVQVHLLGLDGLHAEHGVAVQRTGAHGTAGHPEVAVDAVQTSEVEVKGEESWDFILGSDNVVAFAGYGREGVKSRQGLAGAWLKKMLCAAGRNACTLVQNPGC